MKFRFDFFSQSTQHDRHCQSSIIMADKNLLVDAVKLARTLLARLQDSRDFLWCAKLRLRLPGTWF